MATFNADRTFGVEIEVKTNLRGSDIVRLIDGALADLRDGVRVYGTVDHTSMSDYGHTAPLGWKVISDGSLGSNGRRGLEIVSPILSGAAGLAQLKAVCSILVAPAFTVDKECGLHVHHGIEDLTGQQIGLSFALYSSYQTTINYMVSPSRRQHFGYTKQLPFEAVSPDDKFKNNTPREATNKIRRNLGCYDPASRAGRCRCGARYHTMNPLSILTQNTIEFRQHHGTTEYAKISNWVLFTQAIIESAKEMKVFPKPSKDRPNSKTKGGNFYRLKAATRYTPKENQHRLPEQAEIYAKMWRYYWKIVQKFAQRDGIEVSQIGR